MIPLCQPDRPRSPLNPVSLHRVALADRVPAAIARPRRRGAASESGGKSLTTRRDGGRSLRRRYERCVRSAAGAREVPAC